MAEGLNFVLERFGKAYKIDQWQVFQSFDPKVKSKYISARRTQLSAAAIASEAIESLGEAEKSKAALGRARVPEAKGSNGPQKKEGLAGADLERLVRESVSSDAAVKGALDKAAASVACAYEKQVDEQHDYAMDVVGALRLSFVEDPVFRRELETRLRGDHLTGQDFDGFWRGIDALLAEMRGVLDPSEEKARERVVALQSDVMVSFILACLWGARDYRQDLGRPPEPTPGFGCWALGGAIVPKRARLAAVLRTGEGPEDYALPSNAAELEFYKLDETRRARIGRDRAWCKGAGAVAVVTGAAFASGRHAEISYDDGTWWLSDCSKNGTLVTRAGAESAGAGGAVSEFVHRDSVELHHGDLICLAPQPNAGMIGPRYFAAYQGAKNYRFELV